MTPTRLQEINEYITELFEALYEWDLGDLAMQLELPTLQNVIMEPQQATYDNPNHPNLELIAKLGIGALKCYTCIEKRIPMQN